MLLVWRVAGPCTHRARTVHAVHESVHIRRSEGAREGARTVHVGYSAHRLGVVAHMNAPFGVTGVNACY